MPPKIKEFSQSFFHGSKAQLKTGDLIVAGHDSNYAQKKQSKYVYFTSNLNVAVWGAELASGEGLGRIYVVEPTGPIENDPNVTDKKFPGNPTNSYRTLAPLEVTGEVKDWEGHSAEEIRSRREVLEQLMRGAAQIIED